MKSCVFPGSFDPLTCGHLDLIRRAAGIFDTVTVAVMQNRAKTGCIPYPERIRMLRKACDGMANVRVELWNGLLADYMRIHPECAVIRGVRSAAEAEQELQSAAINRRLFPGIETVLMPASDGLAEVSSSAVREIASFGGDYSSFVPECNLEDLKKWLKPSVNE